MANIFNKTGIYDTIFFNIQSVTEYGDVNAFKRENPIKYETWKNMAENRYNVIDESSTLNELYLSKACFLPEFCKIVSISYATVESSDDGNLKRNLKQITGNSEVEIIKSFIDVLNDLFADGHYSKPSFIPIMCGHNIIGHDIPLLIKRIVKHRESLKEILNIPIIPLMIKHYLNCKPWDSNVIDVTNVWKFNGNDFISLILISDVMDLKKSEQLLSKKDLNILYWSGIVDNENDTITKIRLQSANYTNVALQFVNEIRQL